MRITMDEIARRAGVSVSTVSRVISGRGAELISEPTRRRVMEVASQLHYQPNRSARALATGRTNTVALWMYSLQTSFHAQVVYLTEQALRRHGFDCLTYSFEHFEADLPPISGTVDAVIAHECVQRVQEYLQSPFASSAPLVNMGAYWLPEVDHVGIDLYSATHEALQHLFDVGCRRIAYLVNASSYHKGEPRREAYNRFIEEAGLRPQVIIAPDQSKRAAFQAVKDYLARGTPLDGIFCHNDHMAVGAYKALRTLGWSIPDDVALVGCDGIEEIEYLDVPLTTVAQPLEEMCDLAVEFFKKRITQPAHPVQSAVLRPRLVVRQSSTR